MFDLVIRKGTIYDGSGRKEAIRTTDIGISGGKVKVIANLADAEAKETIDATGKIVTPGFIDPHGHSDMSLIANPQAESLVRQGITTQINGQCGDSPSPVTEKAREEHVKDLKELGLDLDWTTMGGYRKALQQRGIAINSGMLVGHNTVRKCVCGYGAVKPDASQMKEMVALVEREMEEGALGFSSGLQYSPGHYADPWELVPLAQGAARHGGIYTTHMRSEGGRLFESIEESLMVAREAGITLEIAHLKSSGKPNWGKMDHALEMIEAAENEGIDIAFDRYPYLAGSTSMSIYFEPWVLDGGREKMMERIQDPELRSGIRKHMDETVNRALGWDGVRITDFGNTEGREVLGKSVQEIAAMRGQEPVDTALQLMAHGNGYVGICTFSMNQEDTDKVLTHRLCSICTDASTRAPYGPLSTSCPHPRSYGSFPRFISEYVRDRKLEPMHEAARRMSALPARQYRLKERGMLRENYWADIVVFDMEKLEDRADYGNPHHYPAGIQWVIVNGVTVIREGEHTETFPGTVL